MSNPEETLERLGCADPKINGAGTVSAAAAIYLASRFAARPQGGLLTAAFLRKADTDTLASLATAILGALHETNWLGNLAIDVQDANYIAKLADLSATHIADPPKSPTRRPKALRNALVEAMLSRRATHGEFPDGRQCRFDDLVVLNDGRVLRARISLEDGQTVLVDLPTDPASRLGGENQKQSPLQRPTSGQTSDTRELASTEIRSTTHSSPLTTSAAANSQPEADAVLSTRSLARSAAFYAQVTGHDIPVRAGTAEITPGLLLRQSVAGRLFDVTSVTVHITVESLSGTTRRLGIESATKSSSPETIEVRDPDGRTVRISERSAT
ncbi:hypothetical protein Smic_12100 [Streptomyces microflavus]|uniref:Uncharacterized protein n=3 Tax=Streptomyces TaxID=1883 RepID=A0A7J0CL40_STRMI|nr:hypothetical protein Smic_12100 [Streptomyces microflavus]